MLDTASPSKITAFRGLNNVTDSLRAGMEWLATADNVNITDTGAIEKREGYALATAFEIEGYEGDIPVFFIPGTGAFTSIYCTLDAQRGYFVAGNKLYAFTGVPSLAPVLSSDPALATLTAPSAEMFWAEINDQVFYNNGTDSGIILPDNTVLQWAWPIPDAPTVVAGGTASSSAAAAGTYQFCCTYLMPDGRETGASATVSVDLAERQMVVITPPLRAGYETLVYVAPANSTVFQLLGSMTAPTVQTINPDNLGRELQTQFFDPLPAGATVVQEWKGRIYAAQYMPSVGQTAVWFSEPLGFHLFNLSSGYILVPGQVHMLAPHKDALIIGTDAMVYSYTGESMTPIADYGVVPGKSWDVDGDRLLIWTTRGICSALPFVNLTEKQVSVAPGAHVASCVVHSGGQKRFVASIQQGGEAFNAR